MPNNGEEIRAYEGADRYFLVLCGTQSVISSEPLRTIGCPMQIKVAMEIQEASGQLLRVGWGSV